MSITISVINAKGGVGKTTIVVNLAAALAKLGLKILVIDTDPQGNASKNLGVTDTEFDVSDLMLDKAKYKNVVINRGDMSVLPTIPDHYDALAEELTVVRMGELRLLKAIEDAREDFDLVLIDCPPSLEIITANALYCSDYYLIPMFPKPYSMSGRHRITRFANKIADFNKDLKLLGYVFNQYNPKTPSNMAKAVHNTVKADKKPVFETNIRIDKTLYECILSGKHVFEYVGEKQSNGTKDFMSLANEIKKSLGI